MKDIALSPLELNPEANVRRTAPRAPELRPPNYEAEFDSLTVFYDCFVSADGAWRVLLGPPLFNLETDIISAFPDLFGCKASTQIRFYAPPPEAKHNLSSQLWLQSTLDRIEVDPTLFRQNQIVVQPNESQVFSGRRVLLTLSKDNEIRWIRDWVTFFARRHGCDAVLFYDNASTKYGSSDIYKAISSVPGIRACVVVHWPYKYGPQGSDAFHDRLKNKNEPPPMPWDSTYCQPGMLEHARHRFLSEAEAVVNADIDELILTKDSEPVFNLVHRSESGYLQYPGHWIESITERPTFGDRRHLDFCYREKEPASGFMWKWAVAPRRCPMAARWLPHSVSRMKVDPLSGLVSYRHFRAINTSWKYAREKTRAPSEDAHVKDEELESAMEVLRLPQQEAWFSDLEHRLQAQEIRLQTMSDTLETRDREIRILRDTLASKDAELRRVLHSASWRMTAPIRSVRRASAYIQRVLRNLTY